MSKATVLVVLVVTCILLTGCHDNLASINTNPNAPTSVPTSNLLTNAQRELVTEVIGMDAEAQKPRWAIQYMQYWSNTLYTSTTRYEQVEEDWRGFYEGGLADLQEIIRLNTNETTSAEVSQYGSNGNQIAVAKILQVWAFQNITDIWGDIPYSDALKGRENFSPAYDPQEAVYNGLVDQLDDALSSIDEGEAGPDGDLIFEGDMGMWRLFANSLKLRIGMRMSEVEPATAEATVRDAVSDGVIGSVDESVTFPYLRSSPNFNPWYHEAYVEGGSWNLALTNTAIGKLKEYDDPRTNTYAAPSEKDGEYVGIPHGVTSAIASSYANSEVSFQTEKVYNSPGRILSCSEVLLLQAEAAQRGWIDGDPEALYEAGVRASMAEWDVTDDEAIAEYLASDLVAYDPNNFKKKIGNQLWFALYTQPLESWANWRRLDYPVLEPAPNAFRGRDIPHRRGYPASESELNRTNYEAAVARQGPDNLSTRMWWDVE